jgi:predicted  nucleic acid-binding Zn-ribbon protein
MSDLVELLRTLHRIHRQLGDVRERLERGPRQIRAREANLTRLEQALAQSQNEGKSAKIAADQKQLQLRTGEQKIVDLKSKLNQASSNREYQSLREQIAAAEMANSVLADEILDSLEKVDVQQAATTEAQQNLAKGREELAATQKVVREQQSNLETEVGRLETELAKAEENLPADARDTYKRMTRSKGADGMAPVEGNICAGCSQMITPNTFNSLKLGKLVFCGSCGRLIYLPEDKVMGGGGR